MGTPLLPWHLHSLESTPQLRSHLTQWDEQAWAFPHFQGEKTDVTGLEEASGPSLGEAPTPGLPAQRRAVLTEPGRGVGTS